MGQDRKVVRMGIERLPIREDRVVKHIISKRSYSTKYMDVIYFFNTELKDTMSTVLPDIAASQAYIEREARLRTFSIEDHSEVVRPNLIGTLLSSYTGATTPYNIGY